MYNIYPLCMSKQFQNAFTCSTSSHCFLSSQCQLLSRPFLFLIKTRALVFVLFLVHAYIALLTHIQVTDGMPSVGYKTGHYRLSNKWFHLLRDKTLIHNVFSWTIVPLSLESKAGRVRPAYWLSNATVSWKCRRLQIPWSQGQLHPFFVTVENQTNTLKEY